MKVGTQIFDAIFHKIHNEGYKFIAISILVTFILLLISKFLGFIGLLITIWVYYFFRDPERVSIDDQDYLVSPADGLITYIGQSNAPKECNTKNQFLKISIFLNIFNVHVNRTPIAGKIKNIVYVPGKFINATLEKSSSDNERNIITIEKENKENIK